MYCSFTTSAKAKAKTRPARPRPQHLRPRPRPNVTDFFFEVFTSYRCAADLSVLSHSEPPPTVPPTQHNVDCGHAPSDGIRSRLLSGRQRASWSEMNARMDGRRREWSAEVDRLRSEFFRLKPRSTSADDDGRGDGLSSSSTVVSTDRRRQQRVVDVLASTPAPTTITRQQFQVWQQSFQRRSRFAAENRHEKVSGIVGLTSLLLSNNFTGFQ